MCKTFAICKIGDLNQLFFTVSLFCSQQAAETLNEHIRQIDNENKVVEVIKSFPNDELVSSKVWNITVNMM